MVDRITDDVTRTIEGTELKWSATDEKMTELIEDKDRDRVLKSYSELQKAG